MASSKLKPFQGMKATTRLRPMASSPWLVLEKPSADRPVPAVTLIALAHGGASGCMQVSLVRVFMNLVQLVLDFSVGVEEAAPCAPGHRVRLYSITMASALST
jgi:hypothetical protein